MLSNLCPELRAHVKRAPWVDVVTAVDRVRPWQASFPRALAANFVGAHHSCVKSDVGLSHTLCGNYDLTDNSSVCLRGVIELKLTLCRRITAAAFANLTNLRSLTLREITADAGLAHAQRLEFLDIGEIWSVPEEALRAIARLPRLRELRMEVRHDGTKAFEALNAPHEHLRVLKLSGLLLDAAFFSTPVFSSGGLEELKLAPGGTGWGWGGTFLPDFTDDVLARQQKLVALSLICYTGRPELAAVTAAAVDALPCLRTLNTHNLAAFESADAFPLHGDRLTLTHAFRI